MAGGMTGGSSNLDALWTKVTGGSPAQQPAQDPVQQPVQAQPAVQLQQPETSDEKLPEEHEPQEDGPIGVKTRTPRAAPSEAPVSPLESAPEGAGEPAEAPAPKPRTPQKPRGPRGRKPDPDNTTCELRGFPKSLVQMAKQAAPEASNVRAVAAFLYAHRDPDYPGDYSDVPDEVIELAGRYDRARQLAQLDANISRILSKLAQLEKDGRLERFVLTTLLMNAHGMLGAHVSSGTGINYTPPDFDLVFDELASKSEKYWEQQNLKNGRPIR